MDLKISPFVVQAWIVPLWVVVSMIFIKGVGEYLPKGKSMKLNVQKVVREEVELHFEKHVTIPVWVFHSSACNKCEKPITGDSSEPLYEPFCVVALSEGDTYVFHGNCFALS